MRRRFLPRVIHKLSSYLGKSSNRRLKVGFLVQNATLFTSSYSVYLSLKNECDVFVYALPNHEQRYNQLSISQKIEKNIEALQQHFNVTAYPISSLEDLIECKMPDIIFLQSPFDEHRPASISAKNLSRFTKICYVPYSISIAELPSYHYGIDFFNYCWRIFYESPITLQMCKDYLSNNVFKNRKKKIVVSGHPKIDILKNHVVPQDKIDSCWNLPKAVDVKRIIWAPHWSMKWLDKNGFCQFKKYYKYFLNLLSEQAKIDLVLRPHPLMFETLINHHEMSSHEIDTFIKTFTSFKNASIDTSEYYLDLFNTSDALITDGVSFLAEYQITKKPVIYTENIDNGPQLNKYGCLITENIYRAHHTHDLDHFIKNVIIEGNDYLYEQRMKSLDTHLFYPHSGVGEYIKNNLFESMGISR